MKKPPRGIKPSNLLAHTTQAAEVAAHSAQPTTIALGACCICFDAMVPEQDIRCDAPVRGTAVQHSFHKECIRSCTLFGNKVSNCRAVYALPGKQSGPFRTLDHLHILQGFLLGSCVNLPDT